MTTNERDVDQILVDRVKAGDKRAFELLVLKYQRKLLRLITYFVKNHAEAEDLAQETFIKAYRAIPNFRGDSAFYTWLYRIGVNSAKNYLLTQRRRVPTSTKTSAEDAESFEYADKLQEGSTPESILASKQLAQTVNDAMNDLPEDLRVALSLREIDGLSYEEIADLMECPIGTVRSRIFRARETIATKIRPLIGTSPDKRW